jgi:hypothetical protein
MMVYAMVGILAAVLLSYLVYRVFFQQGGFPEPVKLCVSSTDPPWKKWRVENPSNGEMISVDYDPRRDGEFQGDPSMIPALAAIQLKGCVMMNIMDDGTCEIMGPDGIKGSGRTPSEAYGRILDKIREDIS